MDKIRGTDYTVFDATGQTVDVKIANNPDKPPPPHKGAFNIEVIKNDTGTGDYVPGAGYDGLAIVGSNGMVTLAFGAFGFNAGSGNATIIGGIGDTIVGGTGASQVLDGSAGSQSLIVGTSGNETVQGGFGDTVSAVAGSSVNAEIVLGSGNTLDLTGSLGNSTISGLAGNDLIRLSSSGNTTVISGAGDTISVGGGMANIALGSGFATIVETGGLKGASTVTGFTETTGPGTGDFIRLNHGTDTIVAVMSGATSTDVNGIQSSVLHFSDGTAMTLVGFDPTQINSDFFK